MLVLSRKVGERILIGENISVMVVRIAGRRRAAWESKRRPN